ncbi:hypothetical protein K493DRAFT_298706 [Basidiobolus meristosporus CBS 931.73]|uniref:Uncharacterized protein n=1 Tax=Basidiobolus meristosporus CBS 931.73 TaxID=1314790 RepID=A0A1Y1YRX6_9FUNG|nr:hypothetical protein K493DRAFT_298706 [Basidiobolus meristosporus CBS 931.73]|eukprot:ORY00782.1 hypothetical protein K493DRAFT_298706 [Basidiobolus meristosporus CBS 931.73]
MKSTLLIALITFSVVASQNDDQETQVQDTQDCVNGCDFDDGQCHNQCIKAHFDRHVSQIELIESTFGEDNEESSPVADNASAQTPEPKASVSDHHSSQPTGHVKGDTSSSEDNGAVIPSVATGNGNSRSDNINNGNNHRFNPVENPVAGPASEGSSVHTSVTAKVTIPSTLTGKILNKSVASHGTPTSSPFVGVSRTSARVVSTSILPSSQSSSIRATLAMLLLGSFVILSQY